MKTRSVVLLALLSYNCIALSDDDDVYEIAWPTVNQYTIKANATDAGIVVGELNDSVAAVGRRGFIMNLAGAGRNEMTKVLTPAEGAYKQYQVTWNQAKRPTYITGVAVRPATALPAKYAVGGFFYAGYDTLTTGFYSFAPTFSDIPEQAELVTNKQYIPFVIHEYGSGKEQRVSKSTLYDTTVTGLYERGTTAWILGTFKKDADTYPIPFMLPLNHLQSITASVPPLVDGEVVTISQSLVRILSFPQAKPGTQYDVFLPYDMTEHHVVGYLRGPGDVHYSGFWLGHGEVTKYSRIFALPGFGHTTIQSICYERGGTGTLRRFLVGHHSDVRSGGYLFAGTGVTDVETNGQTAFYSLPSHLKTNLFYPTGVDSPEEEAATIVGFVNKGGKESAGVIPVWDVEK